MGLAEKIREALDKRASNPTVRQAATAAAEAQRNFEIAERNRLKDDVWAAEQEASRRVQLNATLKDFLRLVGSRDLLQEMRRAWTVGRIDRTPEEIPDVAALFAKFNLSQQFPDSPPLPTLPGMGLALRHKIRDTEEGVVAGINGWPDARGSYWSRRELALYTIVGLDESGKPFVTTLHSSQRSADSPNHNVYFYGTEMVGRAKDDQTYCIGYGQPEVIFPDDPDKSKQILEGQLFKIGTDSESFLELEKQARHRVINDYNLPGQARHLASPKWHKRLSAYIPRW